MTIMIFTVVLEFLHYSILFCYHYISISKELINSACSTKKFMKPRTRIIYNTMVLTPISLFLPRSACIKKNLDLKYCFRLLISLLSTHFFFYKTI